MSRDSAKNWTIPKPAMYTPAPIFKAPVLDGNSRYSFDTVAGRPVLMLVMGSAGQPEIKRALETVLSHEALFDDVRACFFTVSTDPEDVAQGRTKTRIPGIRHILDYNRAVSTLYGACSPVQIAFEPYLIVLDRQLRVAGRFRPEHAQNAVKLVAALQADVEPTEWAPVLLAPRILEPDLCRHLIDLYARHGGEESGFMREVDGKTVRVSDYNHKRRSDMTIEDAQLCAALSARINQRLRPLIRRTFQFDASRMERYIVACYDSGPGGYFRPHRDNTTGGTAHRRFAVTINLNADFEGGALRFPEFGQRTYRPPPGGAVVFSCSLLHEATPVLSGRRYAFLPFLYDEEAAAQREANNASLGADVPAYVRETTPPAIAS